MSFTPIPAGTQNWDVPVNAAFTDQDTRITTNGSAITTNTNNISTLQSQVSSLQANASYKVYNVKSSLYGAVGDGVHDDTTNIQSAINAANAAGGGIVYLPAGQYKISAALTLFNRITLRGDGDFVTNIVQSSTTANGLSGSNLIYIVIEHLRLTGPGSGSGEGMVFTTEFDYCIIRDVSTTGWGSTGIEIEQPIVTNLTRVTSFNNGGAGIYIHGNAITGAGTSVSLQSCWAHDNVSNGFSIQNMTYLSFQACAADNQANAGKAGYRIDQCTGFTFSGCGSEGNNFGWLLTGGSTGIVITSPYIFNTPSTGIGIYVSSATNVQIIGATEALPQAGATAAIQVDTGSSCTIQGAVATTANVLAAGTTVVASNASGVRSYPNGVTTPSLTMTGPIAMGANKVTGLANGTAASDAATFGQIPVAGTTAGTYAAGNDSRIVNALQTTGGTMSGAIAMGTNKITGVGNGTAAQDVAAFGQIPVAGTGSTNFAAGNDNRILQGFNGGSGKLQNYLTWNHDPLLIQGTASANVSGTVYLHRVYLAQGQTVTGVGYGVATAGATLTAGQNFVGLYDSTGTRQAVSADQASNWTSTGYKSTNFTSTFSVTTAGFYYVGFLAVGTTPPAFSQQANASQAFYNANTTAGNFKHCSDGTGQTSLPASITLGSTISTPVNTWVALF